MNVAEVALLVSVLSAALSVGGLGWTISIAKKNVPKVKVSLSMGTQDRDPGGGVNTIAVTAKEWARADSLRSRPHQHWILTATNTGQVAMSIESIGLGLCSGTRSATVSIEVDHGDEGPGFGASLPCRLHGGQSVRWAIPLELAESLCKADEVSEFGCIHGQLTLSNGITLTTQEGVRVGQVRGLLTGMLSSEVSDAARRERTLMDRTGTFAPV